MGPKLRLEKMATDESEQIMSSISKIVQTVSHVIFLTLMSLAILSCAQQPGAKHPPGTRQGVNGTPPGWHAWELLTGMDSEKAGFALYTYVLFGHRLDVHARIESDTRERYQNLLNAIVVSTARTSEIDEIPREETNIFYIPALAGGKEPSLKNYDTVLAMRYVRMLSILVKNDNPELSGRLTTNPGPFLISTLMPIGEIGTDQTDLLYTDLSTTNPAAMAEIVSAYKQRITSSSVNRVESFRPLRLALLNIVLNADDNVKLVKAALAEWTP
jgi:hypothetical protein